jgi:[ribosomal protein S5]-alanine N-acetyltransferase
MASDTMKASLSSKLHTDRVLLRAPNAKDVASLAVAMKRNLAHLSPWQPAQSAPASLTHIAQSIERDRSRWRVDLQYALIASPDEKHILGRVSLSGILRGAHQGAFLGYWVDARYLRQGYATEIIARTLGFAFGELGLHRVQAAIMPENKASLAVIRRLGFREEGFAKSYLEIAGSWRDHLLFAKLADE